MLATRYTSPVYEQDKCYFPVNRVSIPFQWEMAPGTPKHQEGSNGPGFSEVKALGDGDHDTDDGIGRDATMGSGGYAEVGDGKGLTTDSGVAPAANLQTIRAANGGNGSNVDNSTKDVYPLRPPPKQLLLHGPNFTRVKDILQGEQHQQIQCDPHCDDDSNSIHNFHGANRQLRFGSFRFLSFRSTSSSVVPLSKTKSSLSLNRHGTQFRAHNSCHHNNDDDDVVRIDHQTCTRDHKKLLELMQQSRNFSELASAAAESKEKMNKSKKQLNQRDKMLLYIVAASDADHVLPLQREEAELRETLLDKSVTLVDVADDDDLDQQQMEEIHPEDIHPDKLMRSTPKFHLFTSCWR